MKKVLCSSVGVVGSGLVYMLGGWDTALQTLVLFMVIDYVMGVAVAFIFHKSPKTESGGLSSVIGFKGLCKKFVMLMFVAIGYRLDILFEIDYIRTAICFGLMANELISITENAGLMGLPIPDPIKKGIDMLHNKGQVDELES